MALPPGKNIRALSLYILSQERPDIINNYPKFAQEYELIISPVYLGVDAKELDRLPKKNDPSLIRYTNQDTTDLAISAEPESDKKSDYPHCKKKLRKIVLIALYHILWNRMLIKLAAWGQYQWHQRRD